MDDLKKPAVPPPYTTAQALAPSTGLVATGLVGTPLAVVVVSLLNRTVFVEQPLSVEEAMAFGGAGATVLGYLFHVFQVLVDRSIIH